MKKFLKWTAILLGGFLAFTLLGGVLLYPTGMKKLSQTYPDIPVEKVAIPSSPAAVARGRHVATVWGCAKCHGENMGGELELDDPFLGTFSATNLTAGKGGIGASYSDADWIRTIRHGVKPDGHGVIFMNNYAALGDQDLGSLIAYLKQIPAVDAEYPTTRYGLFAPLAPAVGLYTPAAELIDHGAPRPADPAQGATIEYGQYLFAVCAECHSTRLAGKLAEWTQTDFDRALQTRALPDGKKQLPVSHLKTYGEMTDTELSALWLYLQSIQTQKTNKDAE